MSAPLSSLPIVEDLDRLIELEDMDLLPERYEVIRGTAIERPVTSWRHTVVRDNILFAMIEWMDRTQAGEAAMGAAYVLWRCPLTVIIPDGSYLGRERVPPGDAARQIPEGPPDLAIEVLETSDRVTVINDRVALYLDAGVRLIWVVDPQNEMIESYSASRPGIVRIYRTEEILDGDDVLPDFQVLLSQIFDVGS